jgi:hypothetical protein
LPTKGARSSVHSRPLLTAWRGQLRRRALPAAVSACLLALASTTTARGEEVFTSQAAAARATDSTWIAAPAQPAAVCIVDTGNDPNPDTTNVIARLSVDGGSGADLDTTGHHGTLMSMIASAPYNGFGMVGAAPSVKVVSVRATRDGGGFLLSDVLNGIDTCRASRFTYNIKVVSLSLGVRNYGPLDAASATNMESHVDEARRVGLSIVAAAGNHPGMPDYPAAYGPVLAVAAAHDSGARCPFAASGPEVDLAAPGCPQDVALPDGRAAWASGSSESSALVAALLAQLRGLRPEFSPTQAEDYLTSTASSQISSPVVDAGAAFKAGGLSRELAQAHDAIPMVMAPAMTPGPSPATADVESVTESPARHADGDGAVPRIPRPAAPAPRGHLPKPRVRSMHCRKGWLSILLANKPASVRVSADVYSREPNKAFPRLARHFQQEGDRLRTRISGNLAFVSITYSDPIGRQYRSVPARIRP